MKNNLWLLALAAALPAAAQIPVNCGDTLNVPGGQYILTGNLTCPVAPAVRITADNVSFDLKGFTLSKSGPATGAAITTATPAACVHTAGVTVSNGNIANFGLGMSICVPGSLPVSTNANIHHLTITGGSTGIGLFNAADNEIHQNVVVDNRGSAGLFAGIGIYLQNSTGNNLHQNEVTGNGADGVALFYGSKDNNVMHNVTKNNSGSGIELMQGSLDNVLKANTSTSNGSFDMKDGNNGCGSNVWRSNNFQTANMGCIK